MRPGDGPRSMRRPSLVGGRRSCVNGCFAGADPGVARATLDAA